MKLIFRNLNEPATPRGCREVLGVLNGVYSSPLARARLPLQPRLILAVALAMSSNKKVGIISHFNLHLILHLLTLSINGK